MMIEEIAKSDETSGGFRNTMAEHKAGKTTSNNPERQAPTVEIEERLLTLLDREVAARPFQDRGALVNAVLSEWLRHTDEEAQQAIHTRLALKKEMTGDDNGGEPGVVYELCLQEVGVVTQPRKQVFFRRHYRGTEDGYYETRTISFPVGGSAWVRERLLPWLSEGLEEAEAVHRAEIAENRRKGQARRTARTDEEKVREAEARRLYSESHGKAVWYYAVSQVNRHRARAERRGLADHFTAPQWINLAASSDFRCPMCEADAPLETHHTHALSAGGTNEINNIQLLCAACHVRVAERGEDGGDEWYAQEVEKMGLFPVGAHVRRQSAYGVRVSDRGVVQEVLPPKQGPGPLWCHRAPLSAPNGRGGRLILPRRPLWPEHVQGGYEQTRMRVLWTRKKGGKTYEEAVPPKELIACSPPDKGEAE